MIANTCTYVRPANPTTDPTIIQKLESPAHTARNVLSRAYGYEAKQVHVTCTCLQNHAGLTASTMRIYVLVDSQQLLN